jgi:hypothetical protein
MLSYELHSLERFQGPFQQQVQAGQEQLVQEQGSRTPVGWASLSSLAVAKASPQAGHKQCRPMQETLHRIR